MGNKVPWRLLIDVVLVYGGMGWGVVVGWVITFLGTCALM